MRARGMDPWGGLAAVRDLGAEPSPLLDRRCRLNRYISVPYIPDIRACYYTIGHWMDQFCVRFLGGLLRLCIMKKRIVLLVLLVIAMPLAILAYANRAELATKLVHLQQADSARIGDYRVPVPRGLAGYR